MVESQIRCHMNAYTISLSQKCILCFVQVLFRHCQEESSKPGFFILNNFQNWLRILSWLIISMNFHEFSNPTSCFLFVSFCSNAGVHCSHTRCMSCMLYCCSRRLPSCIGNRKQVLKIHWNSKPEKNSKPFLKTVTSEINEASVFMFEGEFHMGNLRWDSSHRLLHGPDFGHWHLPRLGSKFFYHNAFT